MLIDVVDGDLPAIDPVAQVALGSVLAAVQVGVTILALTAHVGENRIDVALLTGHPGVHASQRVRRLAVIKLGILADWHPGRGRVAILARSLERTVWIPRGHRGRTYLAA